MAISNKSLELLSLLNLKNDLRLRVKNSIETKDKTIEYLHSSLGLEGNNKEVLEQLNMLIEEKKIKMREIDDEIPL